METVVQAYLDTFFNKQIDFKAVQNLLTDNFTFQGPLMSASSSDDFIEKLKGFGEEFVMKAEFHETICQGDTVVARYEFLLPNGTPVPATEWYKVENGKIKSMILYYDPRSFLEMSQKA